LHRKGCNTNIFAPKRCFPFIARVWDGEFHDHSFLIFIDPSDTVVEAPKEPEEVSSVPHVEAPKEPEEEVSSVPHVEASQPEANQEEQTIVPKKGYDLSFLDNLGDLEHASPTALPEKKIHSKFYICLYLFFSFSSYVIKKLFIS